MKTTFINGAGSISLFIVLSFFLTIVFSATGNAQPVLTFTPFLQNLDAPVEIRNAGDGSGRLFIVEQGGRVKIYKNGNLLARPFMDISDITGYSYYQGLWSIAFAPNFKNSRAFFVLYTGKNGYTELVRYRASRQNPDSADLSTRAVLLSYDGLTTGGPHFGQLHFGPDGFLYVSLSDGSSPDSTTTFAQDGKSVFGKILRLNVNVNNAPYYSIPPGNPYVNNPNILDEIWAAGFRNIWRWSFDRNTGNMWIPDVGGDQAEELNIVKPSQPAGLNFGWPCYEARLNFLTDGCRSPGAYTFPDFYYLNDMPEGGETIIGGYVYRGAAYPALRGYYICSDYSSNNAWRIRLTLSGEVRAFLQSNVPPSIESYGLDENGELYAAALDGIVYRVGATTTSADAAEINNSVNTTGNKIFPTIVRNYIMLQLTDSFQYLYITDVNGHEVLHRTLPGNKALMQINLPKLTTGIYMVQLTGTKSFRQKIYVSQ